jgi:hypothetical protein
MSRQTGPYDTYAYWLMPNGLKGLLTTVFWPSATSRRKRKRSVASLPFPLLAPAKNGREVGEHTFWRGPLWGRTVALQGDTSFTKFDLFEVTGSALWGLPLERLLRQRGEPQLRLALRLARPIHERG